MRILVCLSSLPRNKESVENLKKSKWLNLKMSELDYWSFPG